MTEKPGKMGIRSITASVSIQNPVVCCNPYPEYGINTEPRILGIERAFQAYHGEDTDPDIRENPRIFEALEKAGVLVRE